MHCVSGGEWGLLFPPSSVVPLIQQGDGAVLQLKQLQVHSRVLAVGFP